MRRYVGKVRWKECWCAKMSKSAGHQRRPTMCKSREGKKASQRATVNAVVCI